MKPTALFGAFRQGRGLFTKNLTPGKTFFRDERTVSVNGTEYREFSPRNSKLAAAVLKGSKGFGIKAGSVILYLGAAHGYTPSFVSDIVGPDGLVYCVEFSPSVARQLVFLCEERENLIPILADAGQPDEYAARITGVDVVYQDLAQRDQLGIFLKNVRLYLRTGGVGLLAVKARSVDATRPPKEIFQRVERELRAQQDIEIVDRRELHPFEKDHAMFIIRRA